MYKFLIYLFMGSTVIFGTIHRFHSTISVNFYFYLQHFQQKVFNFSKISGSQTRGVHPDPDLTGTDPL